MKCSGKNCPMQHTYDIGECKIVETCAYATKTPTNADRIRSMGDEELALYFTYETFRIASVLFAACDVKWEDQMELCIRAIAERLDWLQQPAEEKHENKG